MIYAFTASQKSLDFIAKKSKAQGFPYHLYQAEGFSALFVSCKKTSQEIYDLFDIENDQARPVVFFRVTDYYGYASKSLWEWMRLHEND